MNENELLDLLKIKPINHIAIIMDGNGRWAKDKGLERTEGHKIGTENVIEIVKYAKELGVKTLSLYAFSTENWKRPQNEVKLLFSLINKYIDRELSNFIESGARLHIMGDISKLPFINRKVIEKAVNLTKNNTGITVNIGLNYGSRDEITRAVKLIVKDVKNNNLKEDEIDENLISNYLYTKDFTDPDLLIRTGGEIRLSNFMLYQLAYSEFYFTDIYWPDFKKEDLRNAILKYVQRNRRFGGLK